MSHLVRRLNQESSIRKKLGANDHQVFSQAADLIERQQREIDNLKTQSDAALSFSGWMKRVACKAGWSPSEARSDADAVVGYVGMLEEENKALAAHVERSKELFNDWELSGTLPEAHKWVGDYERHHSQSPQTSLAEHDAEVFIQSERALFKALYYAPSSPVKPEKAAEISDWYSKFKQAQSGKDGE